MSAIDSSAELPKVVIVGGGFGGLTAAKSLARTPVRVTLIDRNNHHTFQPLLYQVATAALSPADIAAPIRGILHSQRNTSVLMAEVTGVDMAARQVHTSEGDVPYDYLILATGARHSYFGKDEWEEFAPGLKTLTDATSIRRDILLAFEAAEKENDPAICEALMTFILVGGGPTGVEMAGAIAELSNHSLKGDFRHIDPCLARVLLLEAGPRILSTFSESLSSSAQAALERLGVEVRVNSRVEQIDKDGVIVAGKRIASRSVFWTAGVHASPAGKWLGAEMDRAGRVLVNPDLSVPGNPDIFVIGDTMTREQDGKPLPGVAPVAMQQGRYVADLLYRRVMDVGDMPAFHYVDKGNLATVGRSFAILEKGSLRLSGLFAWLLWLGIHIFYLIGFRNRLLVLTEWAWDYLTYQRGARLITIEDEQTYRRSRQKT